MNLNVNLSFKCKLEIHFEFEFEFELKIKFEFKILWKHYNPGHNIEDILMFDKIFVSPQVKRIVIISNKHGIYELPNDLRIRTLGN